MSDLELPNHGSRIHEQLDFFNTDELAELENDPDAAVDQDTPESDVGILDDVTARIILHEENSTKFVIQDPTSMLAATEKKATKTKKGLHKKSSENEVATVGEGKGKKPATRKRKEKATMQDDADDETDDPDRKKMKREVTAYIFVSSATSGPVVRRPGAGQKSAPSTTTIQRGPFFFNIDDVFMNFKSKLAATLPCKASLLPLGQLQWHYEKPVSDKRKPLVDEAGFKAMQTSLRDRKRDLVVNIHMPPPKRDDTPWDTGNEQDVKDPFNFSHEAAAQVPETLSAKEQIATIAHQSSEHILALKNRYPKGQHAPFPDKHVYKKDNRYWELTDFVLRVWAARIAKGDATIEEAPNSPHFDDAHKLKLPASYHGDQTDANGLPCTKDKENVAPPPAQSYMAPHPPFYGAPLYPQYYPAPPVSAYQPPHIPPYYNHYPPPPPYPYSMFAAPTTSSPQPGPSPRKALRLGISLECFCERYGIPDTDQVKLTTLEYRPGMPGVEKLNDREWKDVAGFSVLGWESFKDAHKQFLKDVHDGKWVSS